MKINCLYCSNEFWIKPCRRKTAKYCSKNCSNLSKIKTFDKKCVSCGQKFRPTNWQLKNNWGKYCSIDCMAKGLKKWGKLRAKHVSKSMKLLWKDPKYREKLIKSHLQGLLIRPTSLEQQMIEIIKRHNLPYKYTGDGSFLIGFKNPDFVNVNGEKKLIEVGNVFHHQGDYIEKRRNHFAQYGWESFIFIGDNLDEKEILRIIK